MEGKNFGLSEEEFKQMRLDLIGGKDDLFEQIFLNHFSDCMAYLKANYNTNQEESYDVSMDTMIEFRKYLLTERIQYGNLRFLFTRMAAQRLIKIKKKAAKIDLTEELPEMLDLTQAFDDEDLGILDLAWNKLSEACKILLKQFYYDNIKLSDLAEIEGKNASALRKQKERCVNSLRLNFQAIL